MQYLLLIIAMSTFAGSLPVRAMDPVMPQISADFMVTATVAATLASGFAITFALVQPGLGILADRLGKPRLILVCLVVLGVSNIAGAFCQSFDLLFMTRIVAGIGGGGVFPISLGLVGDLVPLRERQVAMSRVLAGGMIGNLLGATYAGLIGDLVGWRGVLIGIGVLILVASVGVGWGFRHQVKSAGSRIDFGDLLGTYREILLHPHARVCFVAVMVEGAVIFGLFPFVAVFLAELGEPRLAIAGIVIAGFALGGLVYTWVVGRLLPRVGVGALMMGGAALTALQFILIALGPAWQVQLLIMMVLGCGFFMLHGSLQIFASEISATSRGVAVSLHSFSLFVGQSIGPIAYGYGVSAIGKQGVLVIAAVIMLLLGFVCARLLRHDPTTTASP